MVTAPFRMLMYLYQIPSESIQTVSVITLTITPQRQLDRFLNQGYIDQVLTYQSFETTSGVDKSYRCKNLQSFWEEDCIHAQMCDLIGSFDVGCNVGC